ncbi:MAG: type II toxin-antitoxin system HicB family antitoxin [Smithellaceae bacterium]|nr:type II toxin-antitoxin system HicB family antitoxin [Smithellaceae bacterium]
MSKPMTHKGYCAKIEYSEERGCLVGCVSDIQYDINFQGESVEKIRQAFEKAVDDYLAGCAARNEEPEKPSEPHSVVRVSTTLHRVIAIAARKENKSVNAWLAEACKKPNGKEGC